MSAAPPRHAPDAPAPRWDRFLAEVFDGQPDVAARVHFLEEWVGATLFGTITKWEVCLVLVGLLGANGKSTLLFVLRQLFPREAVQAIEPQLWSNVFHLAALVGARINIVNELPDADVVAGEKFKAVVSGDAVNAAHKHRDPFTFAPRAGHLFACNGLPGTRDQSGGFWRRWGVLTFERTFEGAKDTDLRFRLVRDELPGIAARVVAAAARLERRGRFDVPATAEGAKQLWRLETDQVAQFLADRDAMSELRDANAERAEQAGRHAVDARWTRASHLYARFGAWAKSHGHVGMSSTKFGRRTKELLAWEDRASGVWYALPDAASAPVLFDAPEHPPPDAGGSNPPRDPNPPRATPREDTSVQGMEGRGDPQNSQDARARVRVYSSPLHTLHNPAQSHSECGELDGGSDGGFDDPASNDDPDGDAERSAIESEDDHAA